jgi:PPM family protein phosphatase
MGVSRAQAWNMALEQRVSAHTAAAAQGPVCEARIGLHTDPGKVRSNNEDSLVVFDIGKQKEIAASGEEEMPLGLPGVLLIVADGMGGMKSGELASRMCTKDFPKIVLKWLQEHPSGAREDCVKALEEALRETHKHIYTTAQSSPEMKGMGTTMTAVLLREDHALVAQVGDSRAYLGRREQVTQITRDQTVWESMTHGKADPGVEFSNAPWKNMLSQALGAQEELQVVVTAQDVQYDDWLLLCSDGLYRVVQAEDIARAFWSSGTPKEKAQRLVALANERGGPDNCSVILCHISTR